MTETMGATQTTEMTTTQTAHRFADKCSKGGPDCRCGICNGALEYCPVCCGAECELTTHCYGERVPLDIREAVCAGELDYNNGYWNILKEPAEKRQDTVAKFLVKQKLYVEGHRQAGVTQFLLKIAKYA